MTQWTQAQIPMLPCYDIPIIRPVAEKKKNPFIRALKKFVYFKPKTFIGTTIVTTLISVAMTSWLQTPKTHHPNPNRTRIENRVINTTNATTQINDLLTAFNVFYMNYQKTTQELKCPTCGEVATLTTTSGQNVEVKCLSCQKAFQPTYHTENQHE